jgi:hypothetical protein
MRILAAALMLVGMLQAPTGAATAQEAFNKLLAKYSLNAVDVYSNPDLFKPKVACGCVSNLLPGFVAVNGSILDCELPQFNPDGSLMTFSSCGGDFIVLH